MSSTSSVIATANTPSLKASRRLVLMPSPFDGTPSGPCRAAASLDRMRAGCVIPIVALLAFASGAVAGGDNPCGRSDKGTTCHGTSGDDNMVTGDGDDRLYGADGDDRLN